MNEIFTSCWLVQLQSTISCLYTGHTVRNKHSSGMQASVWTSLYDDHDEFSNKLRGLKSELTFNWTEMVSTKLL